tara:strand:+ start:6658 stop:8268 length:1611 start_codon:yes stop_codon:yes gene_type:complete
MNTLDFFEHFSQSGDPFLIWSLPDKTSRFFTDAEPATTEINQLLDRDVYVGVSLQPPSLTKHQRGTNTTVTGLVGLFADIDVVGPGRNSEKQYAKTFDDAKKIIDTIGPAPSIIVMTGGGLQPWWFFSEPWIFEEHNDRMTAGTLLKNWIRTIQLVSQSFGYEIDSTCDLARLLRIPGTYNHKYKENPKIDVVMESSKVYDPADLELYIVDESLVNDTGPAPKIDIVKIDPNVEAPHASQLAVEDGHFRKTWVGKRTDMSDQSPSSYDLAVANEGARRGWTDQQITDAIITRRRLAKENPQKSTRRDYLMRTIQKARTSFQHGETIRELETPIPVSTTDDILTARTKALEKLSKIIGRPVLAWRKGSGEDPLYELILGDPREVIHIGSGAIATSYRMFTLRLFDCGLQLKGIASKHWTAFCSLLIIATEEIENPELSRHNRILGWVKDYLEEIPAVEETEKIEAVRRKLPFLKDGINCIYANSLRQWLMNSQQETTTRASIIADLRHCGFTGFVVSYPGSSRYYWQSPQPPPSIGK